MPSKQVNALAARGLEIKAEMERLSNELIGINTQLIANAEAETIELDAGRVIITNATADRPSGTFDLIFNKQRFLELDPACQARRLAEETGIVRLEQGIIKGRASVVQYSLNKKG